MFGLGRTGAVVKRPVMESSSAATPSVVPWIPSSPRASRPAPAADQHGPTGKREEPAGARRRADPPRAAKPLGKSWKAQALRIWGVEVLPVELEGDVRTGIRDAQGSPIPITTPGRVPGRRLSGHRRRDRLRVRARGHANE